MKTLHTFGAAALALVLAACGSTSAPETPAATAKASATAEASQPAETVGKYTIYNNSGENISELYLYPTGAED